MTSAVRHPFDFLSRLPRWIAGVLAALLLLAASAHELHTAFLQSQFFPLVASRLTWQVEPGESPAIRYPKSGPFDVTRGYTRIPDFQDRLQQRGFRLAEQSRFSPTLIFAGKLGLTPPAAERATAGLVILDKDGNTVYDAAARLRTFRRYEDIPPVVVRSLLSMEDQHLHLGSDEVNPAVDWGRLMRAAFFDGASKLGLPAVFQGGSTLAMQMEKYRHSSGGRTGSIPDKLRQVTEASLRAYQPGSDMREVQRRLVVDYLNSVPLGGAPNYGEVHGIGEGLHAWFGLDADSVFSVLRDPPSSRAEARALKPVLALLCGVRAPSRLLGGDPAELLRREDFYERHLVKLGVLNRTLADRLEDVPIRTVVAPPPTAEEFDRRRAVDATRRDLLQLLGMSSLADLDHLDLEVHTTVDHHLQSQASQLFTDLADSAWVSAQGLRGDKLLATGDPSQVTYSLLLFEKLPQGDVTRVHADNLDEPFDPNTGMRMELGSTAKLRTLADYLETIERLHGEIASADSEGAAPVVSTSDPLTAWVSEEMARDPDMPLDTLFARALERSYSGDPGEVFFTGGGLHVFHNFEPSEDHERFTVREAFEHSVNLAFVRLMRDLVRYREARLPYDAAQVMDDPSDTLRTRMLAQASDEEALIYLRRAYDSLRGTAPEDIPAHLLGRGASERKLAILYEAWHHGAPADSLAAWLRARGFDTTDEEAARLTESYGKPELTWLDYAYLLDLHPLELWCGGALEQHPDAGWDELASASRDVRDQCQQWLFAEKHRGAQDLRLRIRIERDAFAEMWKDWHRLGFPFSSLVPSYATAIGSSADRPEALADLMGIIVNGGVRKHAGLIESLRFGRGTPYETAFEIKPAEGDRVMSEAVSRALRNTMVGVVERGTARRIDGAFAVNGADTLVVGGKTGSGDNRINAVARNGERTSSRATNRTATFVFYVGDRFYGVVTALVFGPRADRYVFTSALPVEVLRRFAPQISSLYSTGGKPAGTETASTTRRSPDTQNASSELHGTGRASGL
jgi:membrane peptidoglycan carboxypeptidase